MIRTRRVVGSIAQGIEFYHPAVYFLSGFFGGDGGAGLGGTVTSGFGLGGAGAGLGATVRICKGGAGRGVAVFASRFMSTVSLH